MSTIQSCFFRKSPSCKSSCRKMGANAQNIPVRGRFKWRQPLFARCLQCATWAFADRRQLRQRGMDRKHSLRCPEREYFAHLGGKNDSMPPRNPKGTPEPKANAPRIHARTEPPKHRPSQGRPPARGEPNCDALDKLSELRTRRSIIQAEP